MEKREIPFHAMGGVYEPDDLDAIHQVVGAVAEGGSFFPLPEETDFQNAFAEHEGARHAIATNSCGTALDSCMMALGIRPGDEVITTPLTFVCTAGAAAARGATIVFADIDERTLNLDPDKVRKKITPRTRAIVPVHFAGLPCDIGTFESISNQTGIPVIYDAAHAIGAKSRRLPIGGCGTASCYSFQGNKNMTCLGEGGAVTTNDGELAEKVRRLKSFGYVYGGPQPRVASIGFNYRMTKVQYAVGLTQLSKIDRVIEARNIRMVRLNELLEDVKEIILPSGHGPGHGSHLHVVRLDTDHVSFPTDSFLSRLKNEYGVGTAKHYPILWSWEAFDGVDYDASDCPNAVKACDQVFSTPVFPSTTEEDLIYIAWAIKECIHDLSGSS